MTLPPPCRLHSLGDPVAHLMLAPVDADAVAERYERSRDEPLADASLIDPAENPLPGGDQFRGTPPR